jgi:hypothetical protein
LLVSYFSIFFFHKAKQLSNIYEHGLKDVGFAPSHNPTPKEPTQFQGVKNYSHNKDHNYQNILWQFTTL